MISKQSKLFKLLLYIYINRVLWFGVAGLALILALIFADEVATNPMNTIFRVIGFIVFMLLSASHFIVGNAIFEEKKKMKEIKERKTKESGETK